jgi:prepilin-type N-terminal cleavage/methylation domain-containing protein
MKKRGFTLVELLVVIAIIGILSSVVFASLSSARGKARTAAAQQTMGSLNAAFNTCLNDGVAIAIPAEDQDGVVGVGTLATCTGGPNYVSLPATWIYCDGAAAGTCAAQSVQTTGVSYSISAFGDGKTVTCTTNGCATI